jgi:hypothetical protein
VRLAERRARDQSLDFCDLDRVAVQSISWAILVASISRQKKHQRLKFAPRKSRPAKYRFGPVIIGFIQLFQGLTTSVEPLNKNLITHILKFGIATPLSLFAFLQTSIQELLNIEV